MKDLVVYPDNKERQLRLMRCERILRERRIKHYVAYSPIGDTIIGKWVSRALIGLNRVYVRLKYGVFIFFGKIYANRWKYGFQGSLVVMALYMYSNEKSHLKQVVGERFAQIHTEWFASKDQNPYVMQVSYKPEKDNMAFLADFNDDQVQAYIKRFSKVATAEMEKYGIPASVKVAIALLESHAGTNAASQKFHNHFGKPMDGPSYQTAWENWRAHSLMLKDQFPELFYLEPDSRSWILGLQKLEYSSDPDFANKLFAIIDQYELNYLNEI